MDHCCPSKRTCKCPGKAPSEISAAGYLLSLDRTLLVEVMLDAFPMLMMQAHSLSKPRVIPAPGSAISLSWCQKAVICRSALLARLETRGVEINISPWSLLSTNSPQNTHQLQIFPVTSTSLRLPEYLMEGSECPEGS